MEKVKKIGFFEKYEKNSQMIEKSSTKLQSFIMMFFFFGFVFLYTKDNQITIEFITFALILLTAIIAPKHIKDFGDIKDKLK